MNILVLLPMDMLKVCRLPDPESRTDGQFTGAKGVLHPAPPCSVSDAGYANGLVERDHQIITHFLCCRKQDGTPQRGIEPECPFQ